MTFKAELNWLNDDQKWVAFLFRSVLVWPAAATVEWKTQEVPYTICVYRISTIYQRGASRSHRCIHNGMNKLTHAHTQANTHCQQQSWIVHAIIANTPSEVEERMRLAYEQQNNISYRKHWVPCRHHGEGVRLDVPVGPRWCVCLGPLRRLKILLLLLLVFFW